MKTKNIYPIYESVEESWERFLKIYDLTNELTDIDYVVPISTQDIIQAWRCMAVFLGNACDLLNGIDFMYEAIYHIRYRQFSENVSTHNELLLTLLIEDELCRCGYAFHVWCNMNEFQSVYHELLFPRKTSQGWRAFCPWYVEMYLAGNMANRIMLKDRRPIDWGEELDCDGATYPYGPDYMRYRITVYEQAMEILLPESNEWYEEWADASFIAERLKDRYKMDFTNDNAGYDNLIGLTVDRKYPLVFSSTLYKFGNITPELLDVLWGEKALEMLQRCFLNIYNKYKAAKKNAKRSRYSQQAIMQSWLYQWIEQNGTTNNSKLAKKVRKAQFNIAMNI